MSATMYTGQVKALFQCQIPDCYLIAGADADTQTPIKYSAPAITINDADGDSYWHTWENVSLPDGVIFLYVKQVNPAAGELAYLYAMSAWVPDASFSPDNPLMITPQGTAQALCYLSWHVRSLDIETARSILPHFSNQDLQPDLLNLEELIYQGVTGEGSVSWNQTASSTDYNGKTCLRYVFSDDVRAIVTKVVAAVASQIQDDPGLQDKKWVRRDGKPAIHRAADATSQNAATNSMSMLSLPQQSTGQLTNEENYVKGPKGFWWRIDPDDPGHGLLVYPGSLNFDGSGVSFDVNNLLMRYYSVYVTYYDVDGTLISTPTVGGNPWTEVLPDEIRGWFQKDSDYPGEKFIGIIGSVWTIAGVPVPVNKTNVQILWADNAASAKLKIGSLGVFDSSSGHQVWIIGCLLTLVVDYMLPLAFMAIGARFDIGGLLSDMIKKDPEILFVLVALVAQTIGVDSVAQGPAQALKTAGELAGSILGGIAVKQGLTKVAALILAKVFESESEDAVPFVGEAFIIISLVIDTAQIVEASIEVAANPAVIELDIKRAFDLTLNITAPNYGNKLNWPDEAATYRAVVKFDHKSSTFVQSGVFPSDLKDRSSDPLTIKFIGLPAGGTFTVEVGLYGGDELCCSIYKTPTSETPSDQPIIGQFTYVQHPLDANTKYLHERALTFDNGTYALAQNPAALTKTLADLGDQFSINRLGQITFDAWNDRLAYSWETSASTDYLVQEFCNVPDEVNSSMRRTEIDSGLAPRVVYNPQEHVEGETLPRRFWLDPTDARYHLREVDDAGTNGFVAGGNSWGRFPFAPLDVDFHPNGYVVAIGDPSAGGSLMALKLIKAVDDSDAPQALPVVRQGTRSGLLQNQVAVSVTPDGRVLVLESGTSPRIQAFDVHGNTVPSFRCGAALFTLTNVIAADLDKGAISPDVKSQFAENDATVSDGATLSVRIKGKQWVIQDRHSDSTPSSQAWIIVSESGSLNVYDFSCSLDLPTGNTPLDLAMELKGFIYVLSYSDPGNASSYRLDIYDPLGTGIICSTENFNVAALVIDPWRHAYTLDFDSFAGSNGQEPMVSEWIPQDRSV